MSHQEQKDYFKTVKDRFPEAFKNKKVLDIGSYDLNGTNAYLFDDSEVIGLDIAAGPGVDIVCEGQKYDAPDGSYDAIVSSECWEHNPYYKETIQNAVRMLKEGGFFLFACATTGRPVHGLGSQQEEMIKTDPTWTVMPSARLDNWTTEYYYNVTEEDVRDAIDVDEIFSSYEFVIEKDHCDLYFWGFKK
jgi:SAM-dependent methyltransferase